MATAERRRLAPVLSASRRIDLPACFPLELAARLQDLGPEGVHTLVLWTKDPSRLLQEPLLGVLRRFESLFLHLTVTGLGGSVLEPRVPPWRVVLDSVPALDLLPGLKREGICLRYDPLIEVAGPGGKAAGNLDPDLSGAIVRQAAGLRLGSIRTSLVTSYPKVVKRLASRGLRLADRVEERGREFLERVMDPLAREAGIPLFTCVLPDRGDPGCIDGATLARLHPRGLRCSLARDRSQRPACRCTKSVDIGSYALCPHGCLYCYANPSPAATAAA